MRCGQPLAVACSTLTKSARVKMNAADFDELSAAEKKHFYQCSRCREMVDRRQLDDVLFHETDHKPRPDIQYGGSVRIEE
jgi:hypothetical protein